MDRADNKDKVEPCAIYVEKEDTYSHQVDRLDVSVCIKITHEQTCNVAGGDREQLLVVPQEHEV